MLRENDVIFYLPTKGCLLRINHRFPKQESAKRKWQPFVLRRGMKTCSEGEIAYLAGLFDGEGCIFISKYRGQTNRSAVYTLHAIVAMTSKEPIEYCKEITGLGNVYFKKSKNINYRDQWRWDAQGKEAAEFLRRIYPWLKVKNGQIDCALEIESLKPKRGGRGYIVPQNISDKREYCYKKVMNLKDERDENDQPERPFDPQIALF